MLRPLKIGLPIIFLVVIAFVVGVNFVDVDGPYFVPVIVGYVVLFPAALLYTIFGTIRAAKRVMAGGDPSLRERGERTMATVTAARSMNMTMRVGGGPSQNLYTVTLRPDNRTPDISVTKAGFLLGAPEVGDRVPVYLDRDNSRNHFIDWAESSGAKRLPSGGNMSQVVAQIQAIAAQAGVPPAPDAQPGAARRDAAPPRLDSAEVGGEGLEGRARIEGLKPYPDGTYDLDLHVTPRARSSYRVATRIAVPSGTGLLQRGQTLKVRIDPEIASRIEVIWD